MHSVGRYKIAAVIILAGGTPGNGMAQLLIYVVHKPGTVEAAGAAPAGDIPATQQALGHGRSGSAQFAGTLKIGTHQGDVLGRHVAAVNLIPTVAQVGQDVHHHARLQGTHLLALGAGLPPDVKHICGDQTPLLLRLLRQGGGLGLNHSAVGQSNPQPLTEHVAHLAAVCNLIPAITHIFFHGDLGALGRHVQGLGIRARLAAQTQAVGGDGGAADGGKRYTGAHGKGKADGGQKPDQLHFEIHGTLPPQYFLWYRPVTCPPAHA